MKIITLDVGQPGVQLGMLTELLTPGLLSCVWTCTGDPPPQPEPPHSCGYGPRLALDAKYLEGRPLNKCPHGLCVNNLLPVVIFTALKANTPFICHRLQMQ